MAKTAKSTRDTGAAGMMRFYELLGVIAVVGVAAVGYNVLSARSGGAALAPLDLAGAGGSGVAGRQGARRDGRGPECPGHDPGVRRLPVSCLRADFPLVAMHPHAFLAAQAARCAEDRGKYWEYHDELYRRQVSWSAEPAPARTFEEYAETLGMDAGAFRSCLHSHDRLERRRDAGDDRRALLVAGVLAPDALPAEGRRDSLS